MPFTGCDTVFESDYFPSKKNNSIYVFTGIVETEYVNFPDWSQYNDTIYTSLNVEFYVKR